MDILGIPIPAIPISYYPTSQVDQIASSVEVINAQFGSLIQQSSGISNLPWQLETAIIFIESDGNPNAVSNSGAIGLMQITPESAYETIRIESVNKRLSDQEKSLILKYLPDFDFTIHFGSLINEPLNSDLSDKIKTALLNPEFNILIGGIYLRYCLDSNKIGGKIRLDKAIIFYDFGPSRISIYDNPLFRYSDINSLYMESFLPLETRDYILKLIGVNGILDIIVNKK